jgi:hypothetical protein
MAGIGGISRFVGGFSTGGDRTNCPVRGEESRLFLKIGRALCFFPPKWNVTICLQERSGRANNDILGAISTESTSMSLGTRLRRIWPLCKGLLALSLVFLSVARLRADSDTEAAKAKYNHKFAEVMQDGLVAGYCSGTMFAGRDLGSAGDRFYVGVGIDEGGTKVGNMFGCPTLPLHKGELLTIDKVRTTKRGRTVILSASTIPHSFTRGIGASEHESLETGHITLVFSSQGNSDALITSWLRFSDTADRDKLGNTASMVQVKEVKLGMSFAEVEQALGVPVTRVDLGTKVLYKYKDMTVEFHDGKVTDVR